MNTSLLLKKASKELEFARTQAAADSKAALLARQLVRAAKIKQRQARKLSKMAKKSAARAEDKSEESAEALESAQSNLKKLQKRIKKERRKNDPDRIVRRSKPAQKALSKPRLARSNRSLLRNRPKAKAKKTMAAPTLRKSPVQSRQIMKASTTGARAARSVKPNTLSSNPREPDPAVRPEPKPVPASGQKFGGLNPLNALDLEAPSSFGGESTND